MILTFFRKKKNFQQANDRSPTFSDPAKNENTFPPVFLSKRLREQLIIAMTEHLGEENSTTSYGRFKIEANLAFWDYLYKSTCADAGQTPRRTNSPREAVFQIIRHAAASIVIRCIGESVAWLISLEERDRRNIHYIDADLADYVPMLNSYLEDNRVDWRWVGTRFTPATPSDAENEFLAPAFHLLNSEGFEGAVEEFSIGMRNFR